MDARFIVLIVVFVSYFEVRYLLKLLMRIFIRLINYLLRPVIL